MRRHLTMEQVFEERTDEKIVLHCGSQIVTIYLVPKPSILWLSARLSDGVHGETAADALNLACLLIYAATLINMSSTHPIKTKTKEVLPWKKTKS